MKLNNLGLYRGKLMVLSGLFAAIALFFSLNTDLPVDAQGGARRVITKSDLGNEPLEIVEISTLAGAMKINEKFTSEGDWIDGLTVRIRNRSSRVISYIELGLDLRRDEDSRFLAGDSMTFGTHPRSKDKETERFRLEPNSIYDLKLSPRSLASIKKLLGSQYRIGDLSVAHLTIMWVGFDNGTRWSGGRYFRPDPTATSGFIPEETN